MSTTPLDEIASADQAPEQAPEGKDPSRVEAEKRLAQHFVLKNGAYRPKVKRIRAV